MAKTKNRHPFPFRRWRNGAEQISKHDHERRKYEKWLNAMESAFRCPNCGLFPCRCSGSDWNEEIILGDNFIIYLDR